MRKAWLIVAVLLSGCFARHGIRPLRPLEIATAPYQDVSTESRAGSLMYEGGCLLFRDAANGAILMPVWPAGSTFNGTAVLFHEPGKADQRVIIAEQFLMEGQSLQWTTLRAGTYVPFKHQCNYQPFFVSSMRPAD
jgi:hypothetical protein